MNEWANNPCERHLNVKTGTEWCPICLVEERDQIREALLNIVARTTQAADERTRGPFRTVTAIEGAALIDIDGIADAALNPEQGE